MRKPLIEEAGRRVRQELEARGLSLRAADRKTGVNYATLSTMSMGQVPEMESVVRFAQGLGLDVAEWLALFGYPVIQPVEPATVREGLEQLVAMGKAKYAQELEYEPVEDDGPILQYTGQSDIPEHDKHLLAEAYRIMEAEWRAKHGQG